MCYPFVHYSDFESSTGHGTGEGLGGWNCYHSFFAYIPGVSERTYTDKELDKLNAEDNKLREYNGQKYTKYEALQKQRQLETVMRAQREKAHLYEVGGVDEDEVNAAKARYRATMSEYARFSKEMNLPQQRDRIYQDGLGNVFGGKTKTSVDNVKNTAYNNLKETFNKIGTNGKRNEIPLSKKQIEEVKRLAIEQGYDGDFEYSDYSNTAFHRFTEGINYYYMVIGTDAYPNNDGQTANERMSVKACVAHEVAHYKIFKRGKTNSVEVLEEVQASLRASKFGVNLSDIERKDLFQDAMDRLEKHNISYEDVKDVLDIWEK